MHKIKARFMADYCSSGMWVFESGVWLNIDIDFLSEHLKKLIDNWHIIYYSLDSDNGESKEEIERFDSLGTLILQIANEEIGNRYDLSLIKYDD